ncbi:hypothetical protein H9K76_20315 [Diaphorobacter ruginosibacter]|uniref:Uncharacterized protein n=1 Tax=Diaphorobacter ruginosibacter TaxID=1715720 RepID=A0A7G9RMJ1_9BURK|nr:hypothetical protein [Diaphorobacter ruginosibacter]QNN56816.1 hypothetical protein H9K76_20315 [Diaphorobacter ruginosibacter]
MKGAPFGDALARKLLPVHLRPRATGSQADTLMPQELRYMAGLKEPSLNGPGNP